MLFVVSQAWLIAHTISDVLVAARGTGTGQAAGDPAPRGHPRQGDGGLALGAHGRRASASAKSDLREALVGGRGWVPTVSTGNGRERPGGARHPGIDALDGYFARYLPQLVLAVIVPVTVVAVVPRRRLDLGRHHRGHRAPDPVVHVVWWAHDREPDGRPGAGLLQRLAGHFLDVVAGLPTLKVFGRAKAQVATIREMTDRYRAATMATLRVAFLSSLILELLATISVALVAVAVGLRLLGGHLSLATRALRADPGARGVPAAAPRSAPTTTPAPKG